MKKALARCLRRIADRLDGGKVTIRMAEFSPGTAKQFARAMRRAGGGVDF